LLAMSDTIAIGGVSLGLIAELYRMPMALPRVPLEAVGDIPGSERRKRRDRHSPPHIPGDSCNSSSCHLQM
jgi:hypothetical protein